MRSETVGGYSPARTSLSSLKGRTTKTSGGANAPQFLNRGGTMTHQAETKKFLQALDSTTDKFTFQTFDEKGKDKSLVRILHGTFDQHAEQLEKLNKKGAGVYVTINATD